MASETQHGPDPCCLSALLSHHCLLHHWASSTWPLCFSRGQACCNPEIFLLSRALFLPRDPLGYTPPPISFKSLVTIYLLNETLSDLAFNTFHLITLHTNTHMHTHLLALDSSYPVLFLFSLVLILFTRLCNLPIYIIHSVYCCLYLPCLESRLK